MSGGEPDPAGWETYPGERDRLEGARLEAGTCETAVYREITYSGGFEFVGSFADQ